MVRKVKINRSVVKKTVRGQSMVEFAFVSVFLLLLLLGIMEAGRFLYTYSVMSNAAQEGSRYGIVRPRDVISSAAATKTALAGGSGYPIPTVQVMRDGNCNIVEKTLEKVWGVPRSDVYVSVWYDNGNGTPIPVNTNSSSPNYYDDVIAPGNRVVVQATYKYQFLIPLFSRFMPNGLDIKMTSARSIVNTGDLPIDCRMDATPVPPLPPTSTGIPTPSRTPLPTNTPIVTPSPTPTNTSIFTSTPTRTSTATYTPTATRTSTGTVTPVARLVIREMNVYKPDGNNRDVDVITYVVDQNGVPVTGAFVHIDVLSSVGQSDNTWLSEVAGGGGRYQICAFQKFSGNAGNVSVTAIAFKTGYQQSPALTRTNLSGTICGSTPTNTPTGSPTVSPTKTSTNTPTYTNTPTMTPTNTATFTATPTATPVTCPYSATVNAYKSSGNTSVYVRVNVRNVFGQPVANSSVRATIRNETRLGVTDASGNTCIVFSRRTGTGISGVLGVSGPECYIYNQPFTTQSSSPHGCP
jgi:Flp pilus assembly protein TadG